jgi:hypothetical protein
LLPVIALSVGAQRADDSIARPESLSGKVERARRLRATATIGIAGVDSFVIEATFGNMPADIDTFTLNVQ